MAVLAALPAAGKVAAAVVAKVPVVGKVASFLGGSDAAKDADRDDAIVAAYNRAVAGDVNAALYIRQRTGRYAGVNVPGYGQVSSGGSDHSQRIAREHWARVKGLPNGVADRANALYAALRSGGAAPGSPQAVLANVTGYRLFGIPAWIVALTLVVVALVVWRPWR